MKNLLRYFILLEAGIVALLATALAEQNKPSGSERRFWEGFARLCGLEVSGEGPRHVEVEKYRIDLLAVWNHCAIMVEAKTKREHVRGGQLQRYYDRLRSKLGKTELLADASTAVVVFLTPSGVGESEFRALVVQEGDRKVHVVWEDVLSLIESSFSGSPSDDTDDDVLYPLLRLGAGRARELLGIGEVKRAASGLVGA